MTIEVLFYLILLPGPQKHQTLPKEVIISQYQLDQKSLANVNTYLVLVYILHLANR